MAIIPIEGATKPSKNSTGLHHAAFSVASLSELCGQYRALKEKGILPARTMNHGVATSMYYADPDENEIELTVEAFESVEELNEWLATGVFDINPVSVVAEAEEICKLVDSGVPEKEILRPHPDCLTSLRDIMKAQSRD